MKNILNKINIRIKNKDGASNLEAIIAMTVAIVVGAALMKFSGSVKQVVNKGTEKVNAIGDNL